MLPQPQLFQYEVHSRMSENPKMFYGVLTFNSQFEYAIWISINQFLVITTNSSELQSEIVLY